MQDLGARPIYLGDSVLRQLLSSIFQMDSFKTPNGKIACQLCVGGQKVNNLQRRLREGLKYKKSMWRAKITGSICVILIGSNDCLQGTPIERFEKTYDWLLRDLRRMKPLKIIICNLPPLRDYSVETYNNSIKKISPKHGQMVDLYSTLKERNDEVLLPDGVHLNRRGLQVILDTLGRIVLNSNST